MAGDIRQAYLEAADAAVELLREPEVAERWDEPSALDRLSVGGLAAHLATQIVRVSEALEEPGEDPIDLLENYRRSPWVLQDPDHESNANVRKRSEEAADRGPAEVAARAADLLGRLRAALAAEPRDRVVRLPWSGWSLRLDDFLLTRMMELVVHSDDLAVSVGVDTPEPPPSVAGPVVDLLSRLAVQRHGVTAVVRALSRKERAPATISAF